MFSNNLLHGCFTLIILSLQVSISASTENPCHNNNGGCGMNAACSCNSPTNAVTCKCNPGYINIGKDGKHECKDKCWVNNGNCGNNAICSLDNAFNVVCTCKPGYINVGKGGKFECKDKCWVNNGNCGDNSNCSLDSAFNVVCTCKPGYINVGKDGKFVCKDNCLIKNGGCGCGAACSHDPTTNKVVCTCKPGYTNVGTDENVVCKDSCSVINGGCCEGAFCSHDSRTYAVICRCKPGYTNVGTGGSVVCKVNPTTTRQPRITVAQGTQKPRKPVQLNSANNHEIKFTDDDYIHGILRPTSCQVYLFLNKISRCFSVCNTIEKLLKSHLAKAGVTDDYPVEFVEVGGAGEQLEFHYRVPCEKQRQQTVKTGLINACKEQILCDTFTRANTPDRDE